MPPADSDFARMIAAWRAGAGAPRPHAPPGESSIVVAVRKRPLAGAGAGATHFDAVTCLNPRVVVHAPKLRLDGISKYLDNQAFAFDHAFDETASTAEVRAAHAAPRPARVRARTAGPPSPLPLARPLARSPARGSPRRSQVYHTAVQPLVGYAFERGGRGTVLAYGQTGSGKTYTISGLYQLVARDIFRAVSSEAFRGRGMSVHVSFLELHGARCVDLLHGGARVSILEDERKRVVCSGLAEAACASAEELLALVARGAAERSTHATEVNAQSSRSHAICEIVLRARGEAAAHGSISLVDLAGSERAADTRHHNAARAAGHPDS